MSPTLASVSDVDFEPMLALRMEYRWEPAA